MKLIKSLVQVLYSDSDLNLSMTLDTLVAMVTSHSSFVSVMFDEHGQESKGKFHLLTCDCVMRNAWIQDHMKLSVTASEQNLEFKLSYTSMLQKDRSKKHYLV